MNRLIRLIRFFALLSAGVLALSALSVGAQETAKIYDPTNPASKPGQAGEKPVLDLASISKRKAFLWEIKSAHSVAWLFGTIHVGKRSFFPLPTQVEVAFKRADKLVVEADILNEESIDAIRALIAYAPPDQLSKNISPALYERLKRQMARLKLPVEGSQPMRPFIIGGLLSVGEFARFGYEINYGVDRYLLNLARADKKTVLELESQLEQIKLMTGMPAALQETFLANTIATLESGKAADQVTGTVNAWQSGDAALMQQVVAEVSKELPGSAELDEILLYGRHKAMLGKIESYLASDQTHFIAVGALHLVGPRGLLALLREKGYEIRQL